MMWDGTRATLALLLGLLLSASSAAGMMVAGVVISIWRLS